MTERYSHEFFSYTDRLAIRSAEAVLPVVRAVEPAQSVADFGCGHGGWLAVWKRLGVAEVVGIDGEYVNSDDLLINEGEFVRHDLTKPLDLGRRFDLVQSLEVAEHLPKTAAEVFIETLTRHGDVVLFSAAAPGQGGMHHVNEQPYDYWRDLFDKRGYVMLDLIRPQIGDKREVEPWYRYNTFVFVNHSKLKSLSEQNRSRQVDSHSRVSDISPLTYRVRKALVRPLPVAVVNQLSRLHTWWVQRGLHAKRIAAQ